MKKETIIDNIFSEFMESPVYSFWENPENIYPQKIKAKIFYDNISRIIKKHKKEGTCLVKDCECLTIKKSHTISKSLFLEKISEKAHVLSPAFDSSLGILTMKKAGINEASTFPGFCEVHEKLFHEFETQGKFTKERHYNLQLFRIICREYYIKTFRKEMFELLLDDYYQNRNESFLKAYKSHPLGKHIESKGPQINSVKYTGNDDTELLLVNEMKKINNEVNEISIFYEKSHSLLENKDDFFSHGFTIDLNIPICLSGRANIKFSENKVNKNIVVFLNVLPIDSGTIIFISSLKENENYIKLYLKEVLSDSESFINLIETWMIRGTDHWFIKPSVWNNIQNEMQNIILSDIHDLRYNIGTPYSKTIFKELKKQMTAVAVASKKNF